jgi:beta-glucosidase
MPESDVLKFPDGFLWGTGISAFQTEGGNLWNDWYHYYKKYDMEMDGCGGKVTDHYNRFTEDFRLAKELNMNTQRISIEWSRLEKEKGVIDQNELKHYKDVLKTLKDEGFTTVVTLHHFTNPTWFANEGGWSKRDSIELFSNYVSLVTRELGEYIDFWIVLNEPYMYAGLCYLLGKWAPEKSSPFLFTKVAQNLVKTHKSAYKIIKKYKPTARVGIASNIMPFIPTIKIDKLVQMIFDKVFNFNFLDKIQNDLDFIGLNYYYPFSLLPLSKDKSDLGWQIYPKGILVSSERVWRRYNKPILITENGIADEEDKFREQYIVNHLRELHKATRQNMPIIGYLYWSLLDNLELTEGFWPRFGLLEVDYKKHTRIVRNSAKRYAEIAKNNSINLDMKEKVILGDE